MTVWLWDLMSGNKFLAISAIVLVAVVMGMSAVAPMIPQAEASHGGPDPPQALCDALERAFATSPTFPRGLESLVEHC